ncbi:MAG: LacI family DNA-binding transcriptional regulator [Rhodoferax sp.]
MNNNSASDTPVPQASPRTPVTLDMVAKLAGVSPSTVSRILNGTAVVSEAKRQAVVEATKALGFVPNPLARGLAGGRTFSIGVVTQAIDSPFYGAALRGIEDELDPLGYSPLFMSAHWNPTAEARCLELLHARRVDGIVVLMPRLSDAALLASAQSLPVVVTGRALRGERLYSLSFDNFTGAFRATEHLLGLGHTQIAFITGDEEHPDASERHRGYRAALDAAGVAYNPDLVVPGMYHEVSGLEAVKRLLAQGKPFTAIFAANDQMAAGAALGLFQHGLRVPQDVSLVGFDDLPNSVYATPPLSTIHQPAYELGRLTAASILQLIAGEQPTAQLPSPELLVRASSAPLRTT